ncbi:MAG: hypothetical protein GY723_11295 [bacterium]|nr:hypothetical protein [bacterium]MCP5067315.1 hypothetical protein [bacterium]
MHRSITCFLSSIALSAGLLAGAASAAPPTATPGPAAPGTLLPLVPDFEAEMKLASSTQSAGSLQTVVVEVRNKGLAKGAQNVTVRIFFTSNPQPLHSAIDAKLIPAPGPGMQEFVAFSPTVPAGTSAGPYFLCAHVSAGSTAGETATANNTHCAAVQVTNAARRATPQRARRLPLQKVP